MNKKICAYIEVLTGDYDCNYCGENMECLSCECCYAFNQETQSSDEERRKLSRVVDNFEQGIMNDKSHLADKEVKKIIVNRFREMLLELVEINNKFLQPTCIENHLLMMSYPYLNNLFNKYLEINIDKTFNTVEYEERMMVLYDTVVNN